MEKNTLLSVVLFSVLFIVIGFGAGFFIANNKGALKVFGINLERGMQDVSSSKIISFSALGEVKDISSQEVVLKSGDEEYKVSFTDKTKIYKPTTSSLGQGYQQVNISEIKTGDYLNIVLLMNPEGNLLAKSVYIITNQGGAAGKN